MVSTLRSRPNYYELLGLQPTASVEEITGAFAREISVFRPHAIGGVAQVSLAFETLRDPTRRKAYDSSLGLDETAPAPRPRFVAAASTAAPPRVADQPKPLAEARTAAFIAASVREPVRRPVQPAASPVSPPVHRPSLERPARSEAVSAAKQAPRAGAERTFIEPPGASEAREVDWKRAGMIAGGLIAAVGTFGALAGWSLGSLAPQPAEQAVTVPLPQAKPLARIAPAEPPMLGYEVAEATPMSRRATTASPKTTRNSRHPVISAAPASPPETTPAFEAQSETIEPATQAPEATVVAASLPLPNAVVARTIQRIGYACGQVASTTAGAAPGVFTVNCTSGHSYQATPVRGRYHFRRSR